MKAGRVDLYSFFGLERKSDEAGFLNCCIHDSSNYYPTRIRPAMIVFAGGGYTGICEREGEPVAIAYAGKGYNIFTLEYSCVPHHYPTQLIEAAMAVAYVKINSKEMGIDPEAVAVAGFSAGGHLAAMISNLYGDDAVIECLKENFIYAKPDAAVLGYPVITSFEYSHSGSIDNISGNDEALKEKLSLERRVTSSTSPTFIWTTVDDDLVPSENSLLYASALKKSGVFFELHAFSDGHHGLGLANRETSTPYGRVLNSSMADYIKPDVEPWFDMSIRFLEKLGFYSKDLRIEEAEA